MANEAFEYLTNWNQTAFEAIKKMTETNVRIAEKLMQENVNVAKSIASESSRMFETMSSCKDVRDIVSKQSALAEDAGKQIIKSARSCADILAEAGQTYSDLFEENIEVANKATKQAAAATHKKAA